MMQEQVELILTNNDLDLLNQILHTLSDARIILSRDDDRDVLSLLAYLLTYEHIRNLPRSPGRPILWREVQMSGQLTLFRCSIFVHKRTSTEIVIRMDPPHSDLIQKILTDTNYFKLASRMPQPATAASAASASPTYVPQLPPAYTRAPEYKTPSSLQIDVNEMAILLNEHFWRVNKIPAEQPPPYPPFVIPKEQFSNYWPGYIYSKKIFVCYILFPVEPAELVAAQGNYQQYAINALKKLLGEIDIFSSFPIWDFVFSPGFNYADSKQQIETKMQILSIRYSLKPTIPSVTNSSGTIVTTLNLSQIENLLTFMKNNGVELTKRKLY